jgi:fluoroquinolone resistance protein
LEELFKNGTLFDDREFRDIRLEPRLLAAQQFEQCRFERCSFGESTFQGCRFSSCNFLDCDLSLARFPGTVFSETSFVRSKLIGVDWTQASWPRSIFKYRIRFNMSSLNHATFIGLALPGLHVIDCAVLDTDFRECDLSQADFSGSDLSASLFLRTNLTGADLSRARNYQIDPTQNTLAQARFSLPEALSLLYSMQIILDNVK